MTNYTEFIAHTNSLGIKWDWVFEDHSDSISAEYNGWTIYVSDPDCSEALTNERAWLISLYNANDDYIAGGFMPDMHMALIMFYTLAGVMENTPSGLDSTVSV